MLAIIEYKNISCEEINNKIKKSIKTDKYHVWLSTTTNLLHGTNTTLTFDGMQIVLLQIRDCERYIRHNYNTFGSFLLSYLISTKKEENIITVYDFEMLIKLIKSLIIHYDLNTGSSISRDYHSSFIDLNFMDILINSENLNKERLDFLTDKEKEELWLSAV